nr:MAG TPA: hypothetical protein [Bacteriophage sp.]
MNMLFEFYSYTKGAVNEGTYSYIEELMITFII